MRFAIDDCGTGYTSLSNLSQLLIDTLKIGCSFICGLPGDEEDKAITGAIIAMGKSLDMTLVAKGVETQEQAEFRARNACDHYQGYLFSKPMSATEIEQFMRSLAKRQLKVSE